MWQKKYVVHKDLVKNVVDIHTPGGASEKLKVDFAYRLKQTILVGGWCTAPDMPIHLSDGTSTHDPERHANIREDVAQAYGLENAEVGFLLILADAGEGPVTLSWPKAEKGFEYSAPIQMQPMTLSAICALLTYMEPGSQIWLDLIEALPPDTPPKRITAAADLQGVFGSTSDIGGGAWGWIVHEPGTHVWLTDEDGRLTPLANAYRYTRPDVMIAMHQMTGQQEQSGFFVHLPHQQATKKLAIRAASPEGVWTITQKAAQPIGNDIKTACAKIFSIEGSSHDLNHRANQFELPLLERLLKRDGRVQQQLRPTVKQIGPVPQEPQVSIIVPLYGRTDFVEHQLMEFAKDPFIRECTEIIYVLDDPALYQSFPSQAPDLFALYGMPFTWIWGQMNRGFSGANNLGRSIAHAERLLFMNSDIFPRGPGWLSTMVQMLDQHPDFGMIAPRLLFPSGCIQHAGMINRWHEELGVWINHHPYMGFDTSLDPHKGLTEVPLVTGACMLMRLEEFDAVGQWDTGYVIGDFEDSDLCFKIRDHGLKVGYLPEVELTHLERQSFKLYGEDSLRQRITLVNAVRHQTRWQKYLVEKTS